MPYERVPQGHPVVVDYFYHEVEVLDDVKVIEHRLDPIAFLLECFLEIGIHVAGNSLNARHPFHSDMIYEVVDNLL